MARSDCSVCHTRLEAEFKGTTDETGRVERYRGIPYGSLRTRWTLATLRTSYESVVDAKHFGPKCPQPDRNSTQGFGPYIPFPDCGEDEFACLNLDILRPRDLQDKLPVFVWIHGGGFSFGAGSDPVWEGTAFVGSSVEIGKPIVLVTINYRLGPFGFLRPPNDSTGPDGNFGLHDQRLALEWMVANIEGFGGDPHNVTIGGESAGGASVHAQVALQEKLNSPPLFRRAMIHSGTAGVMGFCDRADMDEIWRQALVAAKVNTRDPAAALKDMQELPAADLLDLLNFKTEPPHVFLDDYFVSDPLLSRQGGSTSQAPRKLEAILLGDVRHEGSFTTIPAAVPGVNTTLAAAGYSLLGVEQTDSIMDLYGIRDLANVDSKERSRRLREFFEDVRFYLPCDMLREAWPRAAVWNLYATSPFATSKHGLGMSYHTLDLLYLFGAFDGFLREENMIDHLQLGQRMRSMWLDFFHGKEPWQGAFGGSGISLNTDIDEILPAAECRRWDADRSGRMEGLKEFDYDNVLKFATRGFYC